MSDKPQQLSYAPAPPAGRRGRGPGIASVVLAFMVLISLALSIPLRFLDMLLTADDGSAGPLRGATLVVSWGVPGVLALAAVIMGIIAVKVSPGRGTGRVLGTVALSVSALRVVGTALDAGLRRF